MVEITMLTWFINQPITYTRNITESHRRTRSGKYNFSKMDSMGNFIQISWEFSWEISPFTKKCTTQPSVHRGRRQRAGALACAKQPRLQVLLATARGEAPTQQLARGFLGAPLVVVLGPSNQLRNAKNHPITRISPPEQWLSLATVQVLNRARCHFEPGTISKSSISHQELSSINHYQPLLTGTTHYQYL